MSDSLWPRGLEPPRLLCPWNFPGKNTGVSSHFLFQKIFLIHGSNQCLLHWQACLPALAGEFFTTRATGKLCLVMYYMLTLWSYVLELGDAVYKCWWKNTLLHIFRHYCYKLRHYCCYKGTENIQIVKEKESNHCLNNMAKRRKEINWKHERNIKNKIIN